MLHILDDDNRIQSFALGHWFKSVTHCPAPCCDGVCVQCAERAECPHSSHGQGGMCVVRWDGDAGAFVCAGYVVRVRAYSDCRCDEADCEHFVNSVQREQEKRAGGTRPAGVRRAQFLRRLPALVLEGERDANGTDPQLPRT
jgi:hypothetical protein